MHGTTGVDFASIQSPVYCINNCRSNAVLANGGQILTNISIGTPIWLAGISSQDSEMYYFVFGWVKLNSSNL